MPINLLDVKNKKAKLKMLDDNETQLNQTVSAPVYSENTNGINLADVKSGKSKLTPIKNNVSEYNLDGTRKIPSAMNIINNNILNQGAKNKLNSTMQNSLADMLIKGPKKEEQIDLSGKSYLKDTGKTYGELNKNAVEYKNNKAYYNEKNGKYYINDNGKYKEANATPTNIHTMSEAPKNEGDELLKNLSKKTGYTEDEVKSFIDDYNNARWDNTKAKYRVAGDKFKNAGMEVFKVAKEYDKYRPTTDKNLSVMENAIKSTGNALIETGKGIVDFSEGVLDTGLQLGSSKYNPGMWIATGQTPWSKDQSKLNQYQDTAKEIIQKDASQNFIDNTLGYNKILSDGKTVQEILDNGATINSKNLGGQIFRGVGAQIPGLMTGSEGQSLTLMGINSFGSGVEQAYNNGATRDEATTYGLLNAGIETATEKMFAGIGGVFGKGALDDTIKKGIEKKISNQILKKLVDFGLDSVGEGTEEVIGDLLQPIAQKLTYAKKEDLLKLYKNQNFLEDFVSGALSSVVMQGMTLPARNKIMNQNNNQVSLNNQNIENTPQNSNNMAQFNELSKNSINNTTNTENGKIMPKIAYQYEITNNSKINDLRKSASKYFDDSTNTKNLISTIEKVISDKNYNVVFDNTIGDSINAKINTLKNGEVEIKINPNSNRAGEFLLMHEVTHAIETDSMKQLVLDYASKNSEFNQALENLKQTYNTNDVSSEVVADISGQLFGNQEFINNLSMKEPNIFKKIYNKIIEISNKFTGNSRYDLFVKDLKNKWETAYRTQNNNLSESNFSIQTDNTGKKYVNVDTNQNIFDGKNVYEQTKIAKRYILDNFRSKNLLINNDNVSITTKTANEYTHPKNSLQKVDLSSKMKASTELDNLLSISEYKYSNNDDGRHSFAKDGWDYYETTFRIGNREYIGLLNIAKNGNKKMLYDITNLKRNTLISSPVNTATESIGIPFSKDNISQNDINVNDDTSSTKYSIQNNQNNSVWQEHLEENYKSIGTKTYFDEVNKEKIMPPIKRKNNENKKEMPSIVKENKTKKIMDPIEISKMTKEDVNTTPKLPKVERNTKFVDKESSFYRNATETSKFLTDESRNLIANEKDVQYYEGITNEDTLNKAYKKIQDGGQSETLNWFQKDSKKSTAIDIAEGWILMKQYQDSGNYDSMVEVAKKMREIGTNAGQTVQAFNIMERLTPEGMVKYAQSELSEAYDRMVKNKTKEWIDNNRSKFDLTPDEVQFIIDNMKEIQNMDDGYDKRVKLAEIQKIMTDKLPTEKGRKIKTWMRISMLFNPKTQVRNVLGNAVIAPVNYFGDLFSSYADKIIAKKTGVRTTGKMNVKAILKGMKEGAYQSTNDYKKGINTRDMEGNRFEIGEGKSFSDKNIIGRNLNRVDNLLNYVMDAGDRIFSQSSFENSLQNQMILNNTTEVTQDMIDIARTESLQRTWNDNNNYTKFVLDIRRGMNKIGIKGYGLGDILIPFAKTPANLTKAIVDYSPVGLVKTTVEGINLKKSLTNGQYTSKMQHQFVQDLGKATAGSMLYILGYALAKTKIITGESDDDKDVANFLKNTLGTNSYSIKIGNKSFTYDWAQPIASPLSIMSNIVNSKNKSDALLESIIDSLDSAGSILLEQSFLQSINDVLSDNDGVISGLRSELLELPSRAIPTFMKQIAEMTDGTQRQTYVKGKPLESALNSAKVKIPFLSKTLSPSVDTMGNEIKKYGGRNDIFNIFLNPANFNQENKSKAAEEIYNVYKKTGDKTIFPRVAPYSIDKQGLTTKQRAEYQKIGGSIVEKSINELLKNKEYKSLSNEDKAVIINNIVGYASNKAKSEILGTEMSKSWNSVNKYIKNGGSISQFYLNKVVN